MQRDGFISCNVEDSSPFINKEGKLSRMSPEPVHLCIPHLLQGVAEDCRIQKILRSIKACAKKNGNITKHAESEQLPSETS